MKVDSGQEWTGKGKSVSLAHFCLMSSRLVSLVRKGNCIRMENDGTELATLGEDTRRGFKLTESGQWQCQCSLSH